MITLFRYINTFLFNPAIRFNYFIKLGFTNRLGDKRFIEKKYELHLNKRLNTDNVSTFNEKLQWLKLYERKPEYTTMVDKYKVREYISKKIGEEYLIPLFGVWDNPDEIDFNALPNKFVLKCNHNSGLGMCICKDKSNLDVDKVKRELRRGLKQDYYLTGREWPYKNVQRKIIAEQFMKSDEGGLTDYKVHCFNGVPKIVLVCKDRFTKTGLTEDFFDVEWNHLDIKRPKQNNSSTPIAKPNELDEILKLSAKLSKNIPFLRTDFYIIEGKVYFSELTFYPASGFEKFEPEKWDEILGEWIVLPDKEQLS